MSHRISLVIAAFFALGAAGQVKADQIFFDRDAFLAALTGEVAIDFEEQAEGPVVGDPWLPLGIVFDEAGVGDNMGITFGGGADTNIFASNEAADIDISFPLAPATAFGLGIFSNDTHSPSERIIYRGVDNAVLIDLEMPLTDFLTTEFVGYIADVPIALVQFVEDTEGDFAGIGDVAFTIVPEPSTALLLTSGLWLLGLRRRHTRL